jgi:hypothetical protein
MRDANIDGFHRESLASDGRRPIGRKPTVWATCSEMHVMLAPVSSNAGNVVIGVVWAVAGVRSPGGNTPILISAPIPGSKRPLSAGMGKEP